MVKIFVEDTGRGIAPEHLDLVFDEFETLGQVALHHQGTGLGMPISKRIMEAMGGKISVKSQVGVGSTFWIEIPKKQVLPAGYYRARFKNAG
jgi:signal transduction histidine kinase